MKKKAPGNLRSSLQGDKAFPFTILIFLVVFAMAAVLYYHQATGEYASDLTSHIAGALNGEAYSVNGLLILAGYRLTGMYWGIAVLLALVSAVTLYCCAYCYRAVMRCSGRDANLGECFVIAAPLCFMAGIYIPQIFPMFYFNPSISGIASDFTQPWHNSTYLTMRLFALLSVAEYFNIRTHYLEKGVSMKEWITFFLLLTLANASKPNFIIAFAPAVLISLITDFCRTKGKSFKPALQIGFAVLCSLPVLVFQSSVLYSQEAEEPSGIIFTLDMIRKAFETGHFAGYLLAGFIFAAAVSILCVFRKKVTRELTFGWLMYVFAFAERWFLAETGPRATHGNFQWGISLAGLILMVICTERFSELKTEIHRSVYLLLKFILALMIISGVVYFVHLFQGGYYGT